MPGTLYVVATPIGNLADLTPRAREVLASVALIAAEDTRHTRQLLSSCGIGTATTSLHEHNEAQKSAELVARLAGGESIALVSDAGTPLVSDPGFDLVAAARRAGIAVVAIPGACAAIAALSVAGLPAKTAARSERLEQLAREQRTLIFYEAPHRLAEVLRDMTRILGAERNASISRELTKRFETTYSGTLAQLSDAAARDSDMSRGELVIVVSGAPTASTALELDSDALLRALLEELSPSQAAKVAAHVTGLKRSDLYAAALKLVPGEKNG
jgi:16S rRNA (cytidine1402-2'-O)-methyltransferase